MESKNKTIWVTGIISLVVLVVAVTALLVFNPFTNTSNTINVQGVGEVKANPDIISVYFNIDTKGVNASEASDKNSKIYDQLISSLIALGFNENEIVTLSYNVYEDFIWTGVYQKSNGFRAVHTIKLELSGNKMTLISKVVDSGIDSGASVNSINFELSIAKQNEYKAQAMKLAAEDAKMKAEALASGFGKKVGKLVSVNMNEFGYMPWNVYSSSGGILSVAMESANAKQAASNIQPGPQDVSVSVTAVYKIR